MMTLEHVGLVWNLWNLTVAGCYWTALATQCTGPEQLIVMRLGVNSGLRDFHLATGKLRFECLRRPQSQTPGWQLS